MFLVMSLRVTCQFIISSFENNTVSDPKLNNRSCFIYESVLLYSLHAAESGSRLQTEQQLMTNAQELFNKVVESHTP